MDVELDRGLMAAIQRMTPELTQGAFLPDLMA